MNGSQAAAGEYTLPRRLLAPIVGVLVVASPAGSTEPVAPAVAAHGQVAPVTAPSTAPPPAAGEARSVRGQARSEMTLDRATFENPPPGARPRVWWHWMNGNVSWEGAKKDIDWMRRVGIGGLQNFDIGMAPQMVETRLPFMSDGWRDAFRRSAAYADEQGLELAIAASPGWSLTGGPWVSAADGMKKMVWSETRLTGGRRFRGELPRPPSTTGVFQTSTAGGSLGGRAPGQNPPELYADQRVIAFRNAGDAGLPVATVTSSGGSLEVAALSDGKLDVAAIELPAAAEIGGTSWIQFDFGRPTVVRGLTLATPIASDFYTGLRAGKFGVDPTRFRLEASDDGASWRDTGAQVVGGLPQRTASVDTVRARYFRLVSIKIEPEPSRAVGLFGRRVVEPPPTVPINELVLRADPTVSSFEEKAGYAANGNYLALPSGTAGSAVPKASDVVDLTDRVQADGYLDWTPPPGTWTVLRIGYSLTGAMNRPAAPEATGLEVDKLDPAAVRRYMAHYLGLYRTSVGGPLSPGGVRAMLLDSWEANMSNWTPGILEAFRRLRGYDPVPMLPALAGYVIDGPEASDAFLWDWRRTLEQLVKESHYRVLADMSHGENLVVYGEGHEGQYVAMADGMEMKQLTDVPMGAMWQVQRPGDIDTTYFNDIQESASVAHIYGQNITAAESLTGGPPYGSAPWDLKPTADAIMLAGVNRFVIHTSAHQPVDRGPGMTLGVGQFFTRNETWAEQARPWMDYLARASHLLQTGRAANDIAVFYGQAGPVVAAYSEHYPAVPEGYRYDYVNADVILNELSVQDGALVTRSGMRYRALMFDRGTDRVTLDVLRRVKAFVDSGAVLIGKRPMGALSRADDPREFERILDALWPRGGTATPSSERVFASAGEALERIGLLPDFSYQKSQPDAHVMFIHRKLDGGDLYFLSNRNDRAETVTAMFRVSGRVPELWDPATGLTSPASYRIDGERTHVTVPLDRFGSTFVVFQEPARELRRELPSPTLRVIAEVPGPWEVSFQAGRGAPASATFEALSDFRHNADPGIRYFSGVASYSRQLSLSADDLAGGGKVWLDLGKVADLAEVWVNGKLAGTAWKPPYRIDISDLATPGDNRIEIRAVNLWVNRLIGDAQPGVTDKVTLTVADGKPVPGGSAMEASLMGRAPYRADSPLRESGLLGPVSVIRETIP